MSEKPKEELNPNSIVVPIVHVKKEYPIPECLQTWKKECPPTKDFKEMMENIDKLVDFICYSLNEGPETKDSVAKRIMTLDGIFKSLLSKTFMSVYDKVAILNKLSFETMYAYQMLLLASQIAKQQAEEAKKVDDYVG